MHEHVNDEILSYVWQGKMYHKDLAGFEKPISAGNLMMMNAGSSFWHEEKVKEDSVEMLQIFIRPYKKELEPIIQFHDKPKRNKDWYLLAGPVGSDTPLRIRQNVFILDAHPRKGERFEIPVYDGYKPFLYVLNGEIQIDDIMITKQEALTDLENPIPPATAKTDTTIILFFVDMNAKVTLAGTISGR
ncbi:pirin family protein [Oceanobacillus salinisoli]|uniref:pirin family protein n=1 Tax=Oceanobacillus salinisoli TaxID=2678611 RepID=UPI0012E2729D|nr:pirin family protein [Oceanobacillus salinisoli]